jgi:hypothetical protein
MKGSTSIKLILVHSIIKWQYFHQSYLQMEKW